MPSPSATPQVQVAGRAGAEAGLGGVEAAMAVATVAEAQAVLAGADGKEEGPPSNRPTGPQFQGFSPSHMEGEVGDDPSSLPFAHTPGPVWAKEA